MARYWVYIDSKVGPTDVPALRKIPSFTLLTQVCPENEQTWRMADEIIEIKSYFLSPPRASALPAEAVNAEPLPKETKTLLTVLEPNAEIELPRANPLPVSKIEILPPPANNQKEPAGPAALRVYCEVCGYKNPRDVTTCMKCGTDIKPSAQPGPTPATAPAPGAASPALDKPPVRLPELKASPAVVPTLAKGADPAAVPVDLKANPMVEIPVTRILITLLAASLVGALGFGGYKFWIQRHRRSHPVVVKPPVVAPVTTTKNTHPKRGTGKRGPSVSRAKAAALPGVSQSTRALAPVARRRPAASPDGESSAAPTPAVTPSEAAAPYRIIEEATPLKHRQSRNNKPLNKSSAIAFMEANEPLDATRIS
jgi:hypothetical protein